MKCIFCVAFFLSPGLAISEDSRSAVTPIQKVLELLGGMLEKGKAEKHDEQVQFASYKQFCDDTTMEKQNAIADAEEQIEVIKADIQKYAADIELLTKEIAGHEEDISVWKGDGVAAGKVRAIEKADYDAQHKDYTESIEAIQMAIGVLKKQARSIPQASLIQIADNLKGQTLIPPEAKRVLDAFLEQDPDYGLGVSAPESAAYENRSGGVIEMLEKLLTQFTSERTTLEKEEMISKNAFEMLMTDLAAQIEEAENDVVSKKATMAKRKAAKAASELDLTDTIAAMEEDMKYLADLTATCAQKTTDFESRQQLRAEEIEAIEKAMEIISSGAVAGAGEKHLPAALLQHKGAALSQLRADGRSPTQVRVSQFLQDQGRQLNSKILAALAVRVADDAFKKVKKMIQDLIYRLMEEANAEATQKGWCDEELATNAQTRKAKSKEVDTLTSEIDALEAEIAKLTEDITELSAAVAELDKAMAEASELREKENIKNTQTIKDAQDAQTAVAQALTVLKEFYAKAAEATALLQSKKKQAPPPIFEEPYKGMQGESGGVVGMLEVIESDFARLESETKAAEAAAQAEYEEFMHDSELDKTAKQKDIEHKTVKKQDDQEALVTKKDDLESAKKELMAAMAYYDKLKPSCVDSGVSYAERVAQRKAEIESLQEALKILSGETIA